MRCPRCMRMEDKVIESRTLADGSSIRRRRECLSCGYRYTSYERVEERPLMVVKVQGGREPFDPARYMELLKASYTAIKSVNPDMIVVTGAMTPTGAPPPAAIDDVDYLRQMYANGAKGLMDAVGSHPYGGPWPHDHPTGIDAAGEGMPIDLRGVISNRADAFGLERARRARIAARVAFLEDYDLNTARYLVQGVDIWLNNPRRPMEASGTSGMKAALNGVPQLSILDGWWIEGYNGRNGWAVSPASEGEDRDARDARGNGQFDRLTVQT